MTLKIAAPKKLNPNLLAEELEAAKLGSVIVSVFPNGQDAAVEIWLDNVPAGKESAVEELVKAHSGGLSKQEQKRTSAVERVRAKAKTDPDFAAIAELLGVDV